MRGVVLCEYSGVVSAAFRAIGIECWSCDILPTEGDPAWHLQKDAVEVAYQMPWDFAIMHPPCTHLSVSGSRHFVEKRADGRQLDALVFVQQLMNAPIERWALENPISIISSVFRKPDQIIQPWQFGHAETKGTCLWLKGLPPLNHTDVVEPDYMRRPDGEYYRDKKGKRYSRIHYMSGRMADGERGKLRSLTYQGIADAMAKQWGSYMRGDFDL